MGEEVEGESKAQGQGDEGGMEECGVCRSKLLAAGNKKETTETVRRM